MTFFSVAVLMVPYFSGFAEDHQTTVPAIDRWGPGQPFDVSPCLFDDMFARPFSAFICTAYLLAYFYCVFSSACKGDIYNIGVYSYINETSKMIILMYGPSCQLFVFSTLFITKKVVVDL